MASSTAAGNGAPTSGATTTGRLSSANLLSSGAAAGVSKRAPGSSKWSSIPPRQRTAGLAACFLLILAIIIIIIVSYASDSSKNNNNNDSSDGSGSDLESAPTSAPTEGVFTFDPNSLNLDRISLPSAGFSIEIFANLTEIEVNAWPRSLKYSFYGGLDILYVGSRSSSKPYIYAIASDPDASDASGSSKKVFKIFKSETYAPASLALSPASRELYVSLPNATLRCEGINLDAYVKNLYENYRNGTYDDNDLDSFILGPEECPERIKVPLYSWDESAIYSVRRYVGIDPYLSGNDFDIVCLANGVTCEDEECVEYFDDPTHGVVSYLNWPHGTLVCVNVSRAYEGEEDVVDLEMYQNDSRVNVVAQGVRNCVGFDWNPATQEMWFTDNGIDGEHDDYPDDELNVVTSEGVSSDTPQHYGFPWCHTLGSGDPYARDANCVMDYTDADLLSYASADSTNYKELIEETIINCSDPNSHVLPVQALGPHVTALGMRFYSYDEYDASRDAVFPVSYNNTVFIAQRGSFSRADKIGYRVAMVQIDAEDGSVTQNGVFAEGWLNSTSDTFSGRPVDLELMSDGSMIVSDDTESVLYRIYYNVSVETGTDDGNTVEIIGEECDFSYATV